MAHTTLLFDVPIFIDPLLPRGKVGILFVYLAKHVKSIFKKKCIVSHINN